MDSQGNLAVMPKAKKKPRKPSVRIRGQGSLFKRGEIFWMELNWKGSRTRKSLETTDRETALIKLDAAVSAIRSGEIPKTFEPITVQSMFDIWMVEVERNCKARTIEDYKSRWNGHLKPVFGSLFATQVNKDKISAYLHQRMKEGAGTITQNRENRVLQMIFNANRKKISANDFPEFPKFHSEKSHVRKGRLSKADFQTLLTRLEDPKNFWLRVLITMTFKFGFRKSELLRATVSYFDAANSVFTLPPYATKNSTERRVPIQRDGEIYRMLSELTKGRSSDAALFTRNGKPVRDYRGAWAVVTEGLTNGRGGHVTIHDLRRSAISEAKAKGFSAADFGSHLTADVFNRYVSRIEGEEQAIAARIEGD